MNLVPGSVQLVPDLTQRLLCDVMVSCDTCNRDVRAGDYDSQLYWVTVLTRSLFYGEGKPNYCNFSLIFVSYFVLYEAHIFVLKFSFCYDLLKIIANNIHYKYNLSTCMSHHFKLK